MWSVNLVTACCLGAVEGFVGIFHEVVEAFIFPIERGNADADGATKFAALPWGAQFFYNSAQALGRALSLRGLCLGEDDDEFLAADVPQQVAGAQRCAKGIRQGPENLVARGMAIGVVETFETVDVDHHQSQGAAMPLGHGQFVPPQFENHSAVVESGQRIDGGMPVKFFCQLLVAGDVLDGRDKMGDVADGGKDRGNLQVLPVEDSVLAPVAEFPCPFQAAAQGRPQRFTQLCRIVARQENLK